jgi:hypothetical protein
MQTYRTDLLGKALPSTFTAQWRSTITKLLGPPSAFQKLAELTERMREGTDIVFHPPPEPVPQPPRPPEPRRGRPTQHDWLAQNQEAERFSRAYRHASGELPEKNTLLAHMCRWWKRQKTLPERKVIARKLPRHLFSDKEPNPT